MIEHYNQLKINNKGMSLVEMIVVVLLVGILSTGVIMGISIISNQKAMDCSKRISAAFDEARTKSLSRMDKDFELTLYYDRGYYTSVSEPATPDSEPVDIKHLGDASLNILINGTDLKSMAGSKAVFQFDKGTGAFLNGSGLFLDGSCIISINGNRTKTLVLVERTGRNYIE